MLSIDDDNVDNDTQKLINNGNEVNRAETLTLLQAIYIESIN